MKKIEIFLNKYMGTISVFLGFSVLLIYLLQYIQLPVWGFITSIFGITKITKTISLEFTITTIGAIIAFWYGYKKYERDKDIEMIDKYLIGKLSAENMEEIKKWRISFLLNEEGYIKEWIWEEVESENQETFFKFLEKNLIGKLDNDFSEKFTRLVFQNKTFEEYIKDLIKSEIIKKEKYLMNKKFLKEKKELIKEEIKQLIILIKVMEDLRKIL